MLDYIRDGAEIYRRSFAIIRAEADLSGVPPDLEKLAVRVVHACGMVDIVSDLRWSAGAGAVGRRALADGAPILCDSPMVAQGVTRSRLPADNAVALLEPGQDVAGAVLAFGADAAALAALAERGGKPALLLAFPAGFGAAEAARAALIARKDGPAYVTLAGPRGGSAMAVAAINALASERE